MGVCGHGISEKAMVAVSKDENVTEIFQMNRIVFYI